MTKKKNKKRRKKNKIKKKVKKLNRRKKKLRKIRKKRRKTKKKLNKTRKLKKLQSSGQTNATAEIPGIIELGKVDGTQAFVEGVILGSYRFLDYKTEDKDKYKPPLPSKWDKFESLVIFIGIGILVLIQYSVKENRMNI